jgi:hypothetical protein
MFDDWKHAWRQAVENFRREMAELEGGDASPAVRAMRRDLASARGALSKLEEEIARTRADAAEEREQEAVCRRRETLAQNIGDTETARLAAEYGVRHAERAVILERKADVLTEERGLLQRDLEAMDAVVAQHPAGGSTIEDRQRPEVLEERARADRDFAELDREQRERAAEQRLEELKRKMR